MLRLIELTLAGLNAVSKIRAWRSLSGLPTRYLPTLKNCSECPRPEKLRLVP
jgi:hypothetical protein